MCRYDLYRFSLINIATSRVCGGEELWNNIMKRDNLGGSVRRLSCFDFD
jgi:hypothetical protein